MKNRFTIGEMSMLFNVPIKTLRYYDEIGLLKPIEVDKYTKYRYYSTEQFEQLDMINYLKSLGIALKDIRVHIENRDINHFLELLKLEREATLNKIAELMVVSHRFANRVKEIEEALTIPNIGQVIIKNIPERTVLSLKEKMGSISELEFSVRKLEKMTRIPLFIGKVGFTISEENLNKWKFDEYDSVYFLLEENVDNIQSTQKITGGDYACIYYHGSHSGSNEYYKKVMEYIRASNYQVAGEALERTIIDELISMDKNSHLTEIQIPIKKQSS
ncbi:MAG: bmrR [Firmicutes bacterium]|nr:bmrR [Bacillota bacterium]